MVDGFSEFAKKLLSEPLQVIGIIFILPSANYNIFKKLFPHSLATRGKREAPPRGVDLDSGQALFAHGPDDRPLAAAETKPRMVICKIAWYVGEIFPRIGFIFTNSNLESQKVVKIYNGRADIEN